MKFILAAFHKLPPAPCRYTSMEKVTKLEEGALKHGTAWHNGTSFGADAPTIFAIAFNSKAWQLLVQGIWRHTNVMASELSRPATKPETDADWAAEH